MNDWWPSRLSIETSPSLVGLEVEIPAISCMPHQDLTQSSTIWKREPHLGDTSSGLVCTCVSGAFSQLTFDVGGPGALWRRYL